MPEEGHPPIQGRMEEHGPLTDDLISPEDELATPEDEFEGSRRYVEDDLRNQDITSVEPPDELDAYGNRLVHEGEWEQREPTDLTEEDVAETHDWRKAQPEKDQGESGWINEKAIEDLEGERRDESSGRPLG